MSARDMIMADAIETAIEARREVIKYKAISLALAMACFLIVLLK